MLRQSRIQQPAPLRMFWQSKSAALVAVRTTGQPGRRPGV
jgi:hypothetical protein